MHVLRLLIYVIQDHRHVLQQHYIILILTNFLNYFLKSMLGICPTPIIYHLLCLHQIRLKFNFLVESFLLIVIRSFDLNFIFSFKLI